MTVIELHKLAYTRMPRESMHATLHDWARDLFGLESLKACTPAQLDRLAKGVRALPVLAKPQDGVAATPRGGRPRSGKAREPGVTRMITDAQVDLINRLASDMGWSESMLRRLFEREFGLVLKEPCDPRELGTSKYGSMAINLLIGFKRSQQKARNPVAAGLRTGRDRRSR